MTKSKTKAKLKLPGSNLKVAREALKDSDNASNQRQWRAFVRERHLAQQVLDDDREKRKLKKRIKELEDGLVRACDLAIDAADVIDDEKIVDPEDEESEDFRYDIGKIRTLVKRPEADRHVARRKQREVERRVEQHTSSITDEAIEQYARSQEPELWAHIDRNADDDDWNGATALNARNTSLRRAREALEQRATGDTVPLPEPHTTSDTHPDEEDLARQRGWQ